MSFRGLSNVARLCPSRGASRWSIFTLRETWHRPRVVIRQCRRSAKTKTTVKLSSLPQGVLPPLPVDEDPVPTTASYPTVMQQHLNHVRQFEDCVVLTRVGDFYEMYFDQVEQFAPLVNLKKAKRSTAMGDVPMAGFQHTQLDRYLKMFVQDLGQKVAIAEQIRLPRVTQSTGKAGALMYDRKVTRVVTAGTLVDETFIDPYENNYLVAIHLPHGRADPRAQAGVSWIDLSSGDFFTQACNISALSSIIARIGPRELVLAITPESAADQDITKLLGDGTYSVHYHRAVAPPMCVADWRPFLEQDMPPSEVSKFEEVEVAAGGLILDYVRDKLLETKILLQQPIRRSDGEYMAIDKQSLRGLEIRNTLRDGAFQGSLLHAVRRTVTKSGARLLARRLVSPSMCLTTINNRLDLVQELIHHDPLREDCIALLHRTSDCLRVLQRFSIGRGDADDLLGLARTIDVMTKTASLLHEHIIANQDRALENVDLPSLDFLWDVLSRFDLDGPQRIAKAIESAIDEEGLNRQHAVEDELRTAAEELTEEVVRADGDVEKDPKSTRRASKTRTDAASKVDIFNDIWIMRRNASPTLAKAHRELDDLLDAKQDLERQLRTQLQTEGLTLKWSAQLSHFCHLKSRDSSRLLASLPGARAVVSKTTMCSFYLADWSQLGTRIDDSRLRIRAEEERVFGKLRLQVIENIARLRRNASILDELDVACSSATLARDQNLVRPVLDASTSHVIVGGRHPTIDAGLRRQGRSFTPNDCAVGGSERIYYITGPNMAGKSTYLRQNALITILAQTGCFVPAEYARIGLVDKVFSRVGSADNLYQDQSTFMVEMMETAEILQQATPRSFVIMDEVGRGTTPEDGVAVSFACLHHLHYTNRSRTLFATHFHTLADMTREFESLGQYCTDVAESADGSWSYMHKLRKGVNRSSHALKVARIAGMPESAIRVAAQVLERVSHNNVVSPSADEASHEEHVGSLQSVAQ